MKRSKLQLNENINRLNEIMGNGVEGKNLIIVDIQPEYENYFGFRVSEFTDYINENMEGLNSVTFLYNGADTMGMVSEDEFKYWLVENGLDEDNIYECRFYDKGYAFFRYCMDEGIDEDSIVNLVKFLISNNINSTQDMDEEMWDQYVQQHGEEDLRDLMEFASDCLSVPDLMDYLEDFRDIVICGGGINECFKEVEIALQALDKPYGTVNRFIY